MASQGFLDSLSGRLTREQPAALVPRGSASVAVIFRILDGEEAVLLIRRAERKEDPWSGQVAFPGGLVSKDDSSFEQTAKRETMEEVGIDLTRGGEIFLGYMHQLRARTREIVVVPSVFKLESSSAVVTTPSREVAATQWVPLRELVAKESHSTYVFRRDDGSEMAFPSLVYKDLVIWGLTERILSAIVQTQSGTTSDPVFGKLERY